MGKKVTKSAELTPEIIDNVNELEVLFSQNQASTKKFHCTSLDDSLANTQDNITELAERSKVRLVDHYGNTLAAVGTNDKVESFTNYGYSNDTLNWTLWLALYNDSWVFRRAIDKPSTDEVNCGITLHGKSDFNKVYKTLDKLRPELTDLLKWGKLFGGAIAVMMFDGLKDEDYSKALVKSQIKGKRIRLYVTDRWYGCAQSTSMVRSMRDIDFGKPMYYEVTFANGKSFRVHHSYVLRYENRSAPPLIKRGQLMGWGYAEGAHIINELARDDQLKSSITSLVNKSLIEVIKMSGMRGVFMGTDKGNMQQLRKRLEMVNWGRTYNSLTFLDKDDEYQQYQLTGLSGLAELLEKNMWQIAAALEMQGILYGELKGGLSTDTEAKANYATTIKNRCDADYRPVLHKLLLILFIVYDIHDTPDFDFNSLNRNEENKVKVESIKALSAMLNDLVTNGIISKFQYAQSIKDYMNNDAINLTITDEHLNKLKLEEEQAILDTIKDLSKKRKTELPKPKFASDPGYHPDVVEVEASEEKVKEPVQEEEAQPNQPIEQESLEQRPVEPAEASTDIGENINNEGNGENSPQG